MSSVTFDFLAISTFTIAAIGLLGSPGPAIAALLAVGKAHGMRSGMRFYWGLQVGLASAAAISAAGLVAFLIAVPAARILMMVIATAYLLYLAWKIGTAPVGGKEVDIEAVAPRGGFALAGAVIGITNPKAYVAFAALMAPQLLVIGSALGDGILKWALVVVVMLVVDILWLLLGVALGRASLPPRAERTLNIALGAMIVAAAMLALL